MFKGFTVRRLYKSFGVKGLISVRCFRLVVATPEDCIVQHSISVYHLYFKRAVRNVSAVGHLVTCWLCCTLQTQ
jgi:hypothetical protein